MADDEDVGQKPNKANADDEFLRHPQSGAFIRNPLLDKTRTAPIIFQDPEFKHNCLEEALAEYNCLTVSETSFKDMMRTGALVTQNAAADAGNQTRSSPLARAALSTLTRGTQGYEFVVSLKKSTYVPARNSRRRPDGKPTPGTIIDKLNIEVNDDKEGGLKIEDVKEGLVAAWNRRQHSAFQVRPGDRVWRANHVDASAASPQKVLEEMEQSADVLRLVVRRPGTEPRRTSRGSMVSQLGLP